MSDLGNESLNCPALKGGKLMQYKMELYTWVKEKGAKITLEEFSIKWEEIEVKRVLDSGAINQLNKGINYGLSSN